MRERGESISGVYNRGWILYAKKKLRVYLKGACHLHIQLYGYLV